jgi:hypothetical protein
MFSQLLQIFSRADFAKAVRETGAERHARGFDCWTQFIAMLFCQLGRAHSLREICGGLASCEGRLNHLGVKKPPKRSTLAYANEHRPWQLYEQVFFQLLARCQNLGMGQKKFRFKNKLMSLDSSVIDLCIAVFDWAKFRTTKGAVKLHLLLDHDGYVPCFCVITEGNRHEIPIARQLNFAPGTIVVMDRGYVDYRLFASFIERGVYFVTRMKDNAVYTVIEEREIPHRGQVHQDQVIELSGARAQDKCPHWLRRIEFCDPQTGALLVFLTNHMQLAASTIADVYKERWQIELFFRALKQNLKVKTFLGTSANALKTQIWTALIAMLLLRYLQLQSKFAWSLSNLVALLRMNLFVYRDLWVWLECPFTQPPEISQAVQPVLGFT